MRQSETPTTRPAETLTMMMQSETLTTMMQSKTLMMMTMTRQSKTLMMQSKTPQPTTPTMQAATIFSFQRIHLDYAKRKKTTTAVNQWKKMIKFPFKKEALCTEKRTLKC